MVLPHIGAPELIIILVVVLIIFGVGRLPEVGGAIGRGLRSFRQAQAGQLEETAKPTEAKEEAAPKPTRTGRGRKKEEEE